MELVNSKPSIKEYWDNEWVRRTEGNQFRCNHQKFTVLLEFLKELKIEGKKKLELGCGVCPHAIKMGWNDQNYTGIDLSEVGIEIARANLPKANLVKGDIYKLGLIDKFDVFIALDALEHLPDLMGLAPKIRKWRSADAFFVGNIPMYCIVDGNGAYHHGMERRIFYETLSEFLVEAGFPDIMTKQYYTSGKNKEGVVYLPYLLFRAGQ